MGPGSDRNTAADTSGEVFLRLAREAARYIHPPTSARFLETLSGQKNYPDPTLPPRLQKEAAYEALSLAVEILAPQLAQAVPFGAQIAGDAEGGEVAEKVGARELEAAIMEIPEVKAVRIGTYPDGRPAEVHVLASRTKPAKQIVRDVQSVAMARFGIEIDYRIVSVVQLGEEEAPGISAPRLAVKSVEVGTEGVLARARVVLARQGEEYVGEARGPAAREARVRVVARAALGAVEQLLAGLGHLELEDAQVFRLGPRDISLCSVLLVTPRGEEVYTGSAPVRGDADVATARAVLDSLNRRLALA